MYILTRSLVLLYLGDLVEKMPLDGVLLKQCHYFRAGPAIETVGGDLPTLLPTTVIDKRK